MTNTITRVRVDPTTDPVWQRLLQRHPAGLFHSPEWLRVLPATYGLAVESLVLLDDSGEPEAGLPYCVLSDPRGERVASLPFSDYCDPLVSTSEQWQALADGLLALGLPVSLRCLHNAVPLDDARFPLIKRAHWHGLDLDRSLDDLWMAIDPAARRAIRKAERSGLTVRLAQGEDDLRAFFALHLGIRKYKYGLLAQPFRFFQAIREQFVDSGRFALMLAEMDGEAVGGVLYLAWGETLYYKFSASSLSRLELRPTDLLIWEGIRHAKERGLRRIDLGLSDWDQDGLVRYKRKFASREGTISFLHHASARPATEAEQEVGALLGRLTGLFTDPSVPDPISERAGALLYRYFG
ncbi:MAG TPA: GNAT family N-acetyltransferase [Thermomicrobiaceae bacterium]|nr:GNAT family N-acetyltransferase [Thermomicrobiaceae bacterium]